MTIAEPAFTLGVEEEYLLVDMETGDLASDPPESLVDECVRELGEQVTNEFLQPQVEIGTSVCSVGFRPLPQTTRGYQAGRPMACTH